ncbi:methyltransferase domain-containing protein [Candidatus Thioglobus sp.]|jgi:SAM-dependent methyltransferase|nr:methyltransferase domain-containing protein [Candidatus Thioglobus sp.]
MKTFLHVGCGTLDKSFCLGFEGDEWKEIRLDIDKEVSPDIVGTLTDMSLVKTGSIDAIYSSHNIEHIFPHEIPIALKEFYRVLKDDGIVVITCPDIQSVGEALSQDKLLEPLYDSPMGPVTPFDILYGHRETTVDGNIFMAHKSGFTYSTLDRVFFEAGFEARVGGRRPEGFDLYLVAFKLKLADEELTNIATSFLPHARFA